MINFLLDIMRFDSTSGKESELAKYIADKYKPHDAELEIQKTKFNRLNVFFKWGEPKIIFNSHLDTVPPYIPPVRTGDIIKGRGSCDAKGQVAYLYEACRQLREEGKNNFGLLLTCGEEDGSQGAMKANESIRDCDFIIIGEPTENKLIKASKGNICINLTFRGTSCHSGYPHLGDNAISRMFAFIKRLEEKDFGADKILGKTEYNIGKLSSDNAHNVVSDLVTMKIFFRTTFESEKKIIEYLKEITDHKTEMEILFIHNPVNFHVVEGFETGIVSYGTDAPSFSNVKNKILYGPGSILDAHTENEYIRIGGMLKAVDDVKNIFRKIYS